MNAHMQTAYTWGSSRWDLFAQHPSEGSVPPPDVNMAAAMRVTRPPTIAVAAPAPEHDQALSTFEAPSGKQGASNGSNGGTHARTPCPPHPPQTHTHTHMHRHAHVHRHGSCLGMAMCNRLLQSSSQKWKIWQQAFTFALTWSKQHHIMSCTKRKFYLMV